MRPVKVILSSEDEVKKIVTKGREIRKIPTYAKVTFSSDKTKKQLTEYKILKESLKKRMEDGEQDIKIKYIRGEPRIMKIKN